MSGGPPHHPHNRQVPATNLPNSAWNHLQVPNYFPRQPQLAHMSNEHSILHQPTWHTPTTTEAMKILPHPQVFESLFPRDCVDLSLTRNGNQNGELPPIPISLSVRDTNKINSLPPSALEIQAVEMTKPSSPVLKSGSPGLKSTSPGFKSASPGLKSPSPSLISAPSSLISASALLSSNPSLILGNRNVLPTGHSLISPSPIPKSVSPGLKSLSPGLKAASPGLKLPSSTTLDVIKTQKRSNVRVDSILERLNIMTEKIMLPQDNKVEEGVVKLADKSEDKLEAPHHSENPVSVIVQPTSSFDDNSNSSSILNVPTSTNIRDDDTVSSYSNEDSLDSNKSRRKRKPSKTVRVSKDEEKVEATAVAVESIETVTRVVDMDIEPEKDPICIVGEMLEETKNPEKVESSNELDELIPPKIRRKTSSESETIDDIAAMVQEGLKEKQQQQQQEQQRQLQQVPEKRKEDVQVELQAKPISVSVIKTKENLKEVLPDTSHSPNPMITPAQKKATNTHFVEVENKLEEMFAGIEDTSDPIKSDPLNLDDSKLDDPLLKLDDSIPSTSQKSETIVTSSTEIKKKSPSPKKTKRKTPAGSRRNSDTNSMEPTTKKKKVGKGLKAKTIAKKPVQKPAKVEPVKDVYAYDSGSNTSSTKSKGPFVHIRGPRDSPLSVSVVNTPVNEDDGERKLPRTKKYHDDSEYRHKVRSKGLHCSTLSNKYDAQTKDATWICSFCKRGPHASELSGPTSNREVVPPGDLFGPYFITTQCPEFERRLDDPYDKHFKSKKINRALDEAGRAPSGKKVKRKNVDYDASDGEADIYLGITETNNKTFEVWAHEDCIVWSPGIYLIGPKIVGLEEAVWTSCNVVCRLCNLKGANISCLRRGCLNVMHLCCSRSNNWQFLDDEFKAYCPEHRVP